MLSQTNFPFVMTHMKPIPVAERSKARVCGRSLPGVTGSNPAGSMDICVVCCTLRTKGKARTIRTQQYRNNTDKKKSSGWGMVGRPLRLLFVLSGRSLCDGLITRPEEFYRLCCVKVCDLETRKWVVKASRRRRRRRECLLLERENLQ